MFHFREIPFATPLYDEEVALRYRILRAPLGIGFDQADLAKEGSDHHLGIYDDTDKLLACLIFTPLPSGELKMRQVAVDEDLQGQGVGTILVFKSEEWALKQGYTELVLNARATAVPFYLKLGYKQEPQPFIEVGIPHYKMYKSLEP
jgi:predicted GNAT family N-acyltransferase